MSLWFAPAPPMPPSPELGCVVADWKRSKNYSVVWFGVSVTFGVISLALLTFGAHSLLVAPGTLALLGVLAWVEARRTYVAVGDGWLYVRRFFGGAWTSLSSLESGWVTGRGGATLLLRGPSFRARVPVHELSLRRPTAFHGELARRVLAQRLDLSAQAAFVLRAWANPTVAERGGAAG